MKLILSKEAQKHFNKLPKAEQKKVIKKLSLLQANPLLGKKLSGDLEGSRALRVWPYRIIYTLSKKNETIEVSDVLHRQGAYTYK